MYRWYGITVFVKYCVVICLKHKSVVDAGNSMSADSLSSMPFSPLCVKCSTPRDVSDNVGETSHCDGLDNMRKPPERSGDEKLQQVLI